MKSIFPIIIVMLFLTSCISQQRQTPPGWESLSKIAYRDAKFGMTKSEVMELSIFKNGKVGEKYVTSFVDDSIGKYTYTIRAYFFHDSLYMVDIFSQSRSAEYIETNLKKYADNLKEVISTKYGESIQHSDLVNTERPSISDFRHLPTVYMYEWHINEKVIVVYMMKKSEDSYVVVASTYFLPMSKRAHARE